MSARSLPIALLCLFAATPLAAREPAERLLDDRRYDRQRSQLEPDTLPSGHTTDPALHADPAAVAEDGPVLRDMGIAIDAAGLLPPDEVAELLEPYAGLPLGARRLALLLRRVDARLVAHGWITSRARVATVDRSARTVHVAVEPGRVAEVRGQGVPASSLDRAFPLQPGDVLEQSALEQGVRQINRLRLTQAQVQVLPGEQVGTSVIDVAVHTLRPVGASLALDNLGSPAVGRGRLRAGLAVANALGLFEELQLVHLRSARSAALLASLSIPHGFDTWSLTVSGSSSDSDLAGLTLDTSARTALLAWNRVLALGADRRDALDFSLQRSRIARRIGPVELLTRRSTVARLAWSRIGRDGALQYYVEPSLSFGLPAAGADEDRTGLPDDHVHYQFVKPALSAGLIGRPASGRIEYALQISGQYSRVGLPGGDRIHVGGFSSVRGFEEALAAGDRGHVLRAELRFPTLLSGRDGGLVPYLHADHGAAGSVGGTHVALAGVGAGLRGTHERLDWDVAMSAPLHRPDDLDTGGWTLRFVVNCSI